MYDETSSYLPFFDRSINPSIGRMLGINLYFTQKSNVIKLSISRLKAEFILGVRGMLQDHRVQVPNTLGREKY